MTVSGPTSRSDGESDASPNRNRTVNNPTSTTVQNAQTSPSTSPNQRISNYHRLSSNEAPLDPAELVEGFPVGKLQKLDELISNPRWVIPVLPKGELEVLLDYSILMTKAGVDKQCEPCQRFYREGLLISFTKIMTDDAVSSWRYDIQSCILRNCEKLIDLCVLKLNDEWFPLLDYLAMLLNPSNKFHLYNATRPSEFQWYDEDPDEGDESNKTESLVQGDPQRLKIQQEPFAVCADSRNPKGWLVDLLNRFGSHGGFEKLLEKFADPNALSVPLIYALIRPFGQCHMLLTQRTITNYLMPIVEAVPKFLDGLSDDDLKKEVKIESKNDSLASIVKSLKCILSNVAGQEEAIRQLEMFRLKMILRQLKISSFGGKMSALNEVNRVIASVSYFSQNRPPSTSTSTGVTVNSSTSSNANLEEEEFLTSDRMASWLNDNRVLQIVLQDSLHQPQYVEKLEKVIRFMIKEKSLSLRDLDDIWAAQVGQHEAIVKNVHDLLAKLAWDFTPEQLDHLFECFQASWSTASAKQHEKLLELIRRLAEDDKDGVMAEKVLTLFWTLAHSNDVSLDIIDQALSAHVKILDYSCTQYREAQKMKWLDRCVDELKSNSVWVLPALKQIREICCLYQEAPTNNPHPTRTAPAVLYRHEIINRLQSNHALVILVADNLTNYVDKVRSTHPKLLEDDPENFFPDGRYNHLLQVQERLSFLRFLLKDGQLWLCAPQAKQIWKCLAENAVFSQDREACFRWFSKLMGEEPDLDPEVNKDFFENNILQLDPGLITESGIKCFERFFKAVNCKENKLIVRRRAYLMEDLELIGLDYVWRLVLCSSDEIASKAIELLKETFTNLGPRLEANQVDIHVDFISSCMDRLKASYDTLTVLENDPEIKSKSNIEITKLCRVLKVLHEYVMECDADFGEERTFIPLYRAPRGKQLLLLIRFPNQGRQLDDIEVYTHTNETLGSVRRQILNRMKNPPNIKLELYFNGDLIDSSEDRKILLTLPFKDRTLITCKAVNIAGGSGVGGNGGIQASSPESSSDSSTGGSPQHHYDGPNIELEQTLPGVIMSQKAAYCAFLLQIADKGCSLGHVQLCEAARSMLKLMPADVETVKKLKGICQELSKKSDTQLLSPERGLDSMFFLSSPSQTCYNLEVCYSLLMPGNSPLNEKIVEFILSLVEANGVACFLGILKRDNFLREADLSTQQMAYLSVLKICKLLFAIAGNSLVHMVAEACQSESLPQVSTATHNQAIILQTALQQIPSPSQEIVIRNLSGRLAMQLLNVGAMYMPDHAVVAEILRIAWAAAGGDISKFKRSFDDLHSPFCGRNAKELCPEDIALAREALEVLTLAIALNPQSLEVLCKEKWWHNFIVDLVLMGDEKEIRSTAAEQFLLIATRCSGEHQHLKFFITLLFTVLGGLATENSELSSEYFNLLSRLLNFASSNEIPLNTAESLLNSEIAWLKRAQEAARKTGADFTIDDNLLEGHLTLCRELLAFMSPEKKFEIGSSNKTSINLVKDLLEDFIFPASKMLAIYRRTGEIPMGPVNPVCTSGPTNMAAFDLLVGLCTGCVHNLRKVSEMLTEMFHSDKDDVLIEWEYLPPVGPRPSNGFVGLKNAGATCYMNSVLQQLFMIEGIRNGVLSASNACQDDNEDFSGDDRDVEGQDNSDCCPGVEESPDHSRKEYNVTILKQVQAIFGHLACSKLQMYIPRGLWKHFRMLGEPVNLREQQDAVEFFMSLIEIVDEALKALNHELTMSKILGGLFSDQKICKTCPHRYSREEPFSVISVDVKNHSNLTDSLHEYVKGELLDGSNAYYCERCNKKVDTTKRLCVKKLPPILVIQLKRFDYDFEREAAIKFNDYFEFPRELDMEPYTVGGLAKIEGEAIDCDPSDLEGKAVRKYRLRGMVVHSGQASGGHYYSYIHGRGADGQYRWYKFDDGDVTEIKMDDDEELKAQCYGGEYMSEAFDHLLKRMSYRKQKRWWNAYMLFYTRLDFEDASIVGELAGLSLSPNNIISTLERKKRMMGQKLRMPFPIERSIQKQNVRFLHHRNQYTAEYFQFMRKLINCNVPYVNPHPNQEKLTADGEELALITVQLGSKFILNSCFHTKKTLRGPTQEWYDSLTQHLRHSRTVRAWFCQKALFAVPSRFCEYILECPTAEVRTSFVRMLVYVAHFSLNDGPFPVPLMLQQPNHPVEPIGNTLSDHLLQTVLSLLWLEVPENGRHLSQYFSLFVMYASLGLSEKMQLLKLNVPAAFIQVALDEGPGPPIKYQFAELGKLYQVVSQLVRCCDVTEKCQSSNEGEAPAPNPFLDPSCSQGAIMPIQPQVAELLYVRCNYLKKLIEDANSQDETKKLLLFLCWENPSFSHMVLFELLWQIAVAYTYELKPYIDLLLTLLLMEDSWQSLRIQKALKGIPDENSSRDGIFDTISRSKSHYQKRAYQCIKLLVNLFSQCSLAKQLLETSSDTKRKFSWAIDWLNEELERGRGAYHGSTQYSYTQWSPPAQSNETANGYFLERSNSARLTLQRACELLPEEDIEAESCEDASATVQSDCSIVTPNDPAPITVSSHPIAGSPGSGSHVTVRNQNSPVGKRDSNIKSQPDLSKEKIDEEPI